MKQISNKEYAKYRQYLTDRLHGGTLPPDGLGIICAGFGCDPGQNGRHMPELPAKFGSEGIAG